MEEIIENKACIWKGCRKASPSVLDLNVFSIQKIALGSCHSAILSSCGKLSLLGNNTNGQLGVDAASLNHSSIPFEPLPDRCFIDVDCGKDHTSAVDKDGRVMCWGNNMNLQCGYHEKIDSVPPHKVDIGNVKIIQVACGHVHTIALSDAGELWSWGSGVQLGLVKTLQTYIPQQIQFHSRKRVVSITCGAFHSIGLISNEASSNTQAQSEAGDEDTPTTFTCELNKETEVEKALKDKRMSRMNSSYSFSDVQSPYPSTMPSSVSFGHKFELELQTCANPINQMIQETPDISRHLLTKSPISELMLENEEETCFVDMCSLNFTRNDDVEIAATQDNTSDTTYDFISLTEDVASDTFQREIESLKSNIPFAHQQSLESDVSRFSNKVSSANSVKRTYSLEDKHHRSFSSTCSFLDEFKAKEFLQKQLECVNPLVQESLPSYGSALQSRLESASSAVKLLASNDPANLLSKKFETLLQHVPSSPGVVQDYVSQLTRTVVSNIRTSVDKIVSTGPLEALTEGVSGSVMGVVKLAKRKSFGESNIDAKEISKVDLVHLCVKNSTLNRSDAVSKSTSLNPIDAVKQTHHRNVSLPTGTLESLSDVLRHQSRTVCWDTEVWSWGQGSKGQLGLGDTTDRGTPCLMCFFSHEHISQISAGYSHNVALSHSGQVFVWGDNSESQLGHPNISFSSCPLLLELQCNLPCWNVSAGDKHTLIACDGLDNSPQVFFCGYDPSCSDERLNIVKQLLSVSNLKDLGCVQGIYSGGKLNGCLLRHLSQDDVVKNAVYELSCSERFFCLTIKRAISKFLQPLIQKLDVNECNGLVVGTSIKSNSPANNSHWSYSFRLLFSKLSCLQQLVARNQCDLKNWLLLFPSNPKSISFARDPEKFVSAYASYFKAYCDAVSCRCFEACVKNNKDFFDLILDDFSKFLEDDKFVPSDPPLTLQNLIKLPYYRLRDYKKTLDKIAAHYPAYTSIHADLQRINLMWKRLRQTSDNDLSSALTTASYWKSASPKFLDVLQTVPSRRLVRDGKVFPINLNSGGGSRLFSWNSFVLFNDCFVQVQYSTPVVFPLQITWLEISPDTKTLKNAITLTMPEEVLVLTAPTHSEKAEWVWCIQQTIKSSLGSNDRNSAGANCLSPPIERHANYTFQKSGWLRDVTYTGMWKLAMMHGKGELKWPNGRKYVGYFVKGQMEGHGTMTTPKDEGMEVQDGTWKAGQLHGYGVVRYSSGDVYRGYFVDGKRQGHGIMKQGKFTTTSASIYYGQWLNDKRSGYGVFDDIPRGQKYMGQWFDDNRHGNGIVVTLDGYYFEGIFSNGKMTGKGLFLTEDNHFYEGDFSGFAFSGKGSLTFPNGDCIEGSFGGNFNDGVKINGILRKSSEFRESNQNFFGHQPLPQSFGKMAYPAEQKWEELYSQCYLILDCLKGKVDEDCSKVWSNMASYMGQCAERNKSINANKPILVSDDMNVIPDCCQKTLTCSIWKSIESYLTRAFEHPNHPLGFLLNSLVDVYLATYVGVSAHVRLLMHATLELKAYVENIYAIARHLFPKLPVTSCILPAPEETRDEHEVYKMIRFRATAAALLHPIIIPKVYPPLFNLFVIHNENKDEKYWKRTSLWNKQSNHALMTYLDVDRKYFLFNNGEQNGISLNGSPECYHEAIECLQRISISFSPFEKMLQIHRSFHEINMAVGKSLGKSPQWSMDELFPVFWFVVVRSRIQHLGAEIHFIEELMEQHLENGELGLMFTTLKACYFQILNEKTV